MRTRPVSMDDIARHLGLSRTTVSFVVNGRTDMGIPEQTRDRVWEAVRELGYRPNAGARSLAARRTDLVGLLTDIPSSPFAGGIIDGAQDAAWAADKLLLIMSSRADAGHDAAALELMLGRRVEGCIYATYEYREVALPASALELPTVLVHCVDPDRRLPSVLPDEVAGGYAGTERLLRAGHRRIGLVALDSAPRAATGRRQGYAEALRSAGLPVDSALVRSGPATAEGGFACAAALLELADPPTALFCSTDRMAMGAYDALRERGLRIPEDVAVVGYDNQEVVAAFLRPPLTTVALPFAEMGAAAVRLLAEIAAGGAAHDVVVRGAVVERASV